jgi:predicted small lipoprotein YifL
VKKLLIALVLSLALVGCGPTKGRITLPMHKDTAPHIVTVGDFGHGHTMKGGEFWGNASGAHTDPFLLVLAREALNRGGMGGGG